MEREATMIAYTTIDSPLGELLLVGEELATAKGGAALTSLSMPDQKTPRRSSRAGAATQAASRRSPGS
jgi:hypothetical protein